MNPISVSRALLATLVLAGTIACNGVGEQSTCSKMCTTLIRDCSYDAYPSTDSCMQGCQYNQENGSDIDAMKECVDVAAIDGVCDTFAVIECENAHGANDDAPAEGESDASE